MQSKSITKNTNLIFFLLLALSVGVAYASTHLGIFTGPVIVAVVLGLGITVAIAVNFRFGFYFLVAFGIVMGYFYRLLPVSFPIGVIYDLITMVTFFFYYFSSIVHGRVGKNYATQSPSFLLYSPSITCSRPSTPTLFR